MIGVASTAVERPSGDPLSNLERLIKENSEIQAGNFQLQHEMRAALSERNAMLSELVEVVNKEKDLVETLADLCKKVEQQHTVMEWISKNLNQVMKDRTEKVNLVSEAENSITKQTALIDDQMTQLSELEIRRKEIEGQRNSTSTNIRSVHSQIMKDIGLLENAQMQSFSYKTQLSEMLVTVGLKNVQLDSLQQAHSQAFTDVLGRRMSAIEQLEKLEAESEHFQYVSHQLEAQRTQLHEAKAQISEFQQLIRNTENLESECSQMKQSIIRFCDSLETSNHLVLSVIDEKKQLMLDLIQSVEATASMESRYLSLQEAVYRLRKSQNDSVETFDMYQTQIASIMQSVSQAESELSEKRIEANFLISQNQELLRRESRAKLDFYNIVASQLVEQKDDAHKLRCHIEQCRNIFLVLQESNVLDLIGQDMLAVAHAVAEQPGIDGDYDIETISQYQTVIEMCTKFHNLTSTIGALDLELSENSSKLHQICDEYHSNVADLKVTVKEKNELKRQIANCKTEAERTKAQFTLLMNEKAALYERRLEEEQSSEIRDLGSIPKELLDEMNSRKQQQARKFNDRMNEIQFQIDAVLAESQKNVDKLEPGKARLGMKKLMPRQTTLDPWLSD